MRLGTTDFRNGICMMEFLEIGRSFKDELPFAKTSMFEAISKFGVLSRLHGFYAFLRTLISQGTK